MLLTACAVPLWFSLRPHRISSCWMLLKKLMLNTETQALPQPHHCHHHLRPSFSFSQVLLNLNLGVGLTSSPFAPCSIIQFMKVVAGTLKTLLLDPAFCRMQQDPHHFQMSMQCPNPRCPRHCSISLARWILDGPGVICDPGKGGCGYGPIDASIRNEIIMPAPQPST